MNIDFVVTWLDSNDPKWIASYNKFRGGVYKEDKARYRDWDLFKYWFRAVETYAPWVHKVFLVTNGKNPDWINQDNPKLVLVNHSDYMPSNYLPTFNSCAIELNFHRIEGLSENFVYFNDDMYINAPVTPEYYFKGGLPCDCNRESLLFAPTWDPVNKFNIKPQIYCDIAILNFHFKRKDVVRKDKKKWIGPHIGLKGLLSYLILSRFDRFENFAGRHNEQPMLKSIIKEIWDVEEYWMDRSCTRFRQDISLNPYIIRFWQFARNKFVPTKLSGCFYFTLGKSDLSTVCNAILSDKIKSICINDSPYCDNQFEVISEKLINTFDRKFPNKSSFET